MKKLDFVHGKAKKHSTSFNTSTISMSFLQPFCLLLLCFSLKYCCCTDTFTSNQFIRNNETIASNGNSFKLGFFSPVNTTNLYVGIYYNVPLITAVWVANREKPINDSSGLFAIAEDGNLVVLNGQKQIMWSTNISDYRGNSSAQLLDTGNLVLRDNSSGRILWQSFEHPSDSFVQKMKLGTQIGTDEKYVMTSWKSPTDPSIGSFSAGVGPLNIPQVFVWNGSYPHWRSGPWNGQIFIGIPNMETVYNNGFNFVDDKEGSAYLTFTYANESTITYFSLNSGGTLVQKYWNDGKQDWQVTWSAPRNDCDLYGKCGLFGSCHLSGSPICTCLKGFEPKNLEEWNRGNWTSGCVRTMNLQCDRNNTEDKEDGFLKLTNMKLPDFGVWSNAPEGECGSQCFHNCSCIAYAYYTGIGCMHWTHGLIDIQKFSGHTGATLYLRVAYTELDKKKSMKVFIVITVILGSTAIAICAYFFWMRIRRKRGTKQQSERYLMKEGDAYPKYSNEGLPGDSKSQAKLEELPLYSLDKLANATGNFDLANKLGEGGFGPVYKGKCPEGQEVAVKRLSRSSGQGLEEFMNEVVVISKLQHRNLVRILGCCVEKEEKMLVYEYMPNGSLDTFLFDQQEKVHLDWSKRINIIEGIGRGLLYLHRDSRLKIIHRDLKASNILLDEELNPKISDFGMARIFGGNQDQAKTRRVVGTYGYMAPEYAMGGRFSEKSDVFSFGVLLLEIVSGRRNTSFYQDEHTCSLLGFAWKLWNEQKVLELMDPRISDPSFKTEIWRYVNVGLLCVQDFAQDRPTVSTVLSMLSSEIADLPTPKQPAFTERLPSAETSQNTRSVNNVTVTIVEGR